MHALAHQDDFCWSMQSLHGGSLYVAIKSFLVHFQISQMIFKVSVHNARLGIPKDTAICPPPLASLLSSCWESLPEQRPNAEEVKKSIESLLGHP